MTGKNRIPLSRAMSNTLMVLAMTALCALWVYPFLWLVSASFKGPLEIFRKGLDLVPDAFQVGNYVRAWTNGGFSVYMLNTIIVTIGTVVLVIFHTSLSGYVIGRYRFVGRNFIIGLLAATFVIPIGFIIIPVVDLTRNLGLLNSPLGIILALGGGGQAAAILLYAGFFGRIPKEVEEAAVMDGAGFFRIFFKVMLPLAGPVTATISVLAFLAAWNSFLVPLVFTFGVPSQRTLAVGMLAFVGTNETDWSGMAAAATLSLVPVVAFFFFVQKYFVEGVAGAIKS